ncbi:MAG: glutamine--fructose-6-phosphate transaminase (isomerizing) [Nitriliruptoraceae bacterium]
MCGIIGITGRDDAVDEIVAGLRRLEYRGYDSAGVVAQSANGTGGVTLDIVKRAGKLTNLVEALDGGAIATPTGIGHTRWATHGAPNDRNAHPHQDPTGRVAVVHNGIIENYEVLKAGLGDAEFASETDTEVVAHLVAAELDAAADGDLLAAVRAVVARLEGAFALCVVAVDEPGTIVVAKRQAPLIVAHADGVGYCASDVAALIEHTRDVAALLDGQLARITPAGVEVVDVDGNAVEPHRYTIDWDLAAAEKQGFPHFMLKEIHEQPQAVADTLLGRWSTPGVADNVASGGSGVTSDGDRIGESATGASTSAAGGSADRPASHVAGKAASAPAGQATEAARLQLDELRVNESEFARVDKVFILACGTSLHAGMVGKLAIEHWAGIPVDVEVASEFRYRDPIVDDRTLVIAISQSGETIDTIAAANHARDQRAPVVALCNVVGSTLAREADAVLYTHAGPEVAVASTKAFTTQIVGCLLLGLYLAQLRGRMYASECEEVVASLRDIPAAIEHILQLDDEIAALAKRYVDVDYTMFIGRHAGLPIAYEGALKLKEISYLHAEAFPAGEMKHGPIALIEPGSLVIALAPAGHVFPKMVSNIQEVKARGASVLAIGTEGSTAELEAHADHVLTLPEPPHELAGPVLSVVPLQLFAYHVATLRGEDVDQPRNLAKTVTVE